MGPGNFFTKCPALEIPFLKWIYIFIYGTWCFLNKMPWSAKAEMEPGPFYRVAWLQNDLWNPFCSGLKANHSVWEKSTRVCYVCMVAVLARNAKLRWEINCLNYCPWYTAVNIHFLRDRKLVASFIFHVNVFWSKWAGHTKRKPYHRIKRTQVQNNGNMHRWRMQFVKGVLIRGVHSNIITFWTILCLDCSTLTFRSNKTLVIMDSWPTHPCGSRS